MSNYEGIYEQLSDNDDQWMFFLQSPQRALSAEGGLPVICERWHYLHTTAPQFLQFSVVLFLHSVENLHIFTIFIIESLR